MARRLRQLARLCTAAIIALCIAAAPVSAHVANLLGHGHHVECCCGEHSADDPCGCADCPAVDEQHEQERAERAKQGDESAQHGTMRGCSSKTEAPTTVPAPPTMVVASFALPPPGETPTDRVPYVEQPLSRPLAVLAAPS